MIAKSLHWKASACRSLFPRKRSTHPRKRSTHSAIHIHCLKVCLCGVLQDTRVCHINDLIAKRKVNAMIVILQKDDSTTHDDVQESLFEGRYITQHTLQKQRPFLARALSRLSYCGNKNKAPPPPLSAP